MVKVAVSTIQTEKLPWIKYKRRKVRKTRQTGINLHGYSDSLVKRLLSMPLQLLIKRLLAEGLLR